MKKLMFVMPFLCGGGAERVTAVLASEISLMPGYEVHLAVYKRDSKQEYPVDEHVRWHTMDLKLSGICALMEKVHFLRSTIRSVQPDCVISLGGAGIIALLVLAMTGLRIQLILSERNDPKSNPKGKLLRMLRKWSYASCDGVVFQTHEAMEFFSRGIQRKGKVICNPLTGKLPDRFTGVRDKRIVASCRLNAQKNIDLMIDAFSNVSRRFDDYSLHIYGEGEERQRLEAKIHGMGLDNKVFLEGYSNHIYDEIWKASMFVSSSNYEGISNSMLEAIAMGIPAVCTDCPAGGARETIVHGVNGMLVPVRNREKMVQAMISVLEDGQLAESISKEGEKLRKAISKEKIAEQWVDFANQVAKKYERKENNKSGA